IQNCTISGFANGFEVLGLNLTTKAAILCRRMVIRNNRIEECNVGIWAVGRINEMFIVGNRVRDCFETSIRLNDLRDGSGQILIANNSIKGVRQNIQFVGTAGRVFGVEICNNALVAEVGTDIVRDAGDPRDLEGGRIDHNWRQVHVPVAGTPEAKEWIPSAKDTVVEKLPVIALDSMHPDFFRPVKDSPLATGGAGGDLPTYVGAIPPEGVEPWDWDKTWKARAPKKEDKSDKDAPQSKKPDKD